MPKDPRHAVVARIQAALLDCDPTTRARWQAALQLLEEMELDNGVHGLWTSRDTANRVQAALRKDIAAGSPMDTTLQEAALASLAATYDEGDGWLGGDSEQRTGYEILACPVDENVPLVEGHVNPSHTLTRAFPHTSAALAAIFDSSRWT